MTKKEKDYMKTIRGGWTVLELRQQLEKQQKAQKKRKTAELRAQEKS